MLTIVLHPTRRIEKLGGVEHRVYIGRCPEIGIELEMIGHFRIADPEKRERFQQAVCVVDVGDAEPVTLLSDNGLVRP